MALPSNKISTHLANAFVDANIFLKMKPEKKELPRFAAARKLLPKPFWEGHSDAIDCYWKAWEIAFRNLKKPVPGSGFISNYIDTAFNGNLFMWDSCFIVLFGRYGTRAFNFQRTLDNFYARQHADGFICRELREADGEERFERHDPSSTGPDLLPWAEWEYYLNFGDKKRLAAVFPTLAGLHQWFRANRTWPDGTYWSSGWGCGMDNQPRLQAGTSWKPYAANRHFVSWSHGHMSWIDTTLQQIFTARLLGRMARELGRTDEVRDIHEEAESLTTLVNRALWDDRTAFYYDRFQNGKLSRTMSIGAFWALLAGVAPEARRKRLIAHLENPREFRRPHCVPSLAASHPDYEPGGGYWRGGVWPNTNYMILRGLTENGQDKLAHDIARNHLDNVVKVFSKTGTLWENYSPEKAEHGDFYSTPDFVGWTGLPPIAVLFEYVFGLRADVTKCALLWDVRLLEQHGVENYPFGKNGLLTLMCAARKNESEAPEVRVKTNVPLTLVLKWKNGRKILKLRP